MEWIQVVFVISVLCLYSVRDVACVTATEMRTHLNAIIPTSVSPYYAYVRPVETQENAVVVTADLYLIGINGFDNAQQKLTTTGYLDVGWTDEIVSKADRWTNAAITEVYLPQDILWRPDLALQNGFTSLSGLGNSFLYVKVSKYGTVEWKPYHVFDSACEVDVTYFPFDKTTCDLQFVIWSNTIDLVKVTKGSVGLNIDQYETNSEWDILSVTSVNFETSTTSGVTFSIEMKRKPLYYLLNILIPVIMLGILNVFVFVLPASSGEKSGFSVTAFLSFAVFLTIISTELPQNSEKISAFSAYLFIMTVLSTTIVVVTIFQLRLFHRGEDEPVSNFLEVMVRCTRKVQCVCCIGIGHVAVDEKKRLLAEQITWPSVSDAIDFIGFWVFLIFILVFTSIIFAVSSSG